MNYEVGWWGDGVMGRIDKSNLLNSEY